MLRAQQRKHGRRFTLILQNFGDRGGLGFGLAVGRGGDCPVPALEQAGVCIGRKCEGDRSRRHQHKRPSRKFFAHSPASVYSRALLSRALRLTQITLSKTRAWASKS